MLERNTDRSNPNETVTKNVECTTQPVDPTHQKRICWKIRIYS